MLFYVQNFNLHYSLLLYIKRGESALILAAKHGHGKTVRKLLDSGAKTNNTVRVTVVDLSILL